MTIGLTFGSVCSGIEAASVAWEPLGFRPIWFAEVDAHASRVLSEHWPGVPNLGDMTTIAGRIDEVGAPDILIGGTPCQAFSIAGGGRAGPARTLTTVQRYDALTENFVVEPRTFNWQQTPTLGAPGISQALPTQPQIATVTPSGVRRLTPVECERLQGFPDGHTSILSDAQRYKTLGNSMAVPVIAWIGERIIHTLHNGD